MIRITIIRTIINTTTITSEWADKRSEFINIIIIIIITTIITSEQADRRSKFIIIAITTIRYN